MSDSIKPANHSIQTQFKNISEAQNIFDTERAPNLFSKCITAISNVAASIYYALSGKKPPIIFENPIYQKGYVPLLIKREENQFAKLESIMQDNSISTPEEITAYNQLKQNWQQTKEAHFGKKTASLEETQAIFNFYKSDLDKHPDFFKKVMPTILEILDRPEVYNKSINELANMLVSGASYVDMEAYELSGNSEQDDSNFLYAKLLITAEYATHKAEMDTMQATRTPVEKAQRIYMVNKEAIDTDDALSDSDLKILYKINYLVTSVISDTRFLQQKGLFRQSGVQSKSATLARNIEAQNFSSPTLQLEESKVNSAISAIKQLQKQLIESNKTEQDKILSQINYFQQTGEVKPLAELDHITRICLPLYKGIVSHAEENKMDLDNIAKIAAGPYLLAYPDDSKGSMDMSSTIVEATNFTKAVISRSLS